MAYEGLTNPISPTTYQASGPSLPTQATSESQSTADQSAPAYKLASNRRRSSLQMPGVLKRAVSSPNVRSLTLGDAMSISEKKRSKLGYHRTAVACGHCRRRKIRCIPAYEDASGRCQNCIRLKKDCHFFPVEQQGLPPGRSPRSNSRAEVGTEPDTSVSSASPGILGSSSIEQIKSVNGQMRTPPLSQQSSFQSFQRSGALEQSEFPARPELEYQRSFDHSRHLVYQQTSPRGPIGDRLDAHPSQYFAGHDQQVLSGYSHAPFGSTPFPGSMTTSPQSSAYHFQQASPASDQFTWAPQPPSRSMSIAGTEDLHNTYAAYRSNTYPSLVRRMSMAQDLSHIPQGGHMISPENHLPTVTGAYHHPNTYQPAAHHGMEWPSSMPPPAERPSIAPSEASWYPQSHPNLSNVEEEAHQQLYHAHPAQPQAFRPKPG